LLADVAVTRPSFTLSVPNSPVESLVAQVIQSMVSETGFDMNIDVLEANTASETAHCSRQHALEHCVATDKVMIERRADMRENEKDHQPANPSMERKQLRRKPFVLADHSR
jgi:hypothetical protein